MNQFGPETDKKLNRLSRLIGKAERIITKATKKKDESWEEVFQLFEEFAAANRFIANDGFTLTKQVVSGSPKLDSVKLQRLLKEHYGKLFSRRWNSITVREVSPALLEKAIREGKIEAWIVSECMSTPPESYRRVRPEWTKDDAEKAAILGIKKE